MKLLLSLSALDLLLVLVLVIGCRGDYSEFCHQLSCPEYSVVETTSDFEERQYVSTNWISTTVDGEGSSALLAATNRLRAFWKAQNDAGHEIQDSWPVLITRSGPDDAPQLVLSWFVPPGQEPEITDTTVSLQHREACTVYVRTFGGAPSLSSCQENAEALKKVLSEAEVAFNPTIYTGAFYESYFAISHHNEIWCYGA